MWSRDLSLIRWTQSTLMLGSLALLLPVLGIMQISDVNLGTRQAWTAAMFLGTVMQPLVAILSLLFAIDAWRCGAGPWLRADTVTASVCSCVLTAYLSYWGIIAFRP